MILLILLAVAAQSSDYKIVPGLMIGKTALGETWIRATANWGQPKYADAAMGRFWGTWVSASGSHLDIFGWRGNDTDSHLRVIRVTSKSFRLADGLHTGSSASAFRKEFPSARLKKHYDNPTFGTVALWDDRTDGIAFEVKGGRCVAIAVHHQDEDLESSYVPYLTMPPLNR